MREKFSSLAAKKGARPLCPARFDEGRTGESLFSTLHVFLLENVVCPLFTLSPIYSLSSFNYARRRGNFGLADKSSLTPSTTNEGVARLQNIRTHHVATLGTDRIHHFDHEPHRDWNGLKHGLLELRVRLVLQGPDIQYVPLPHFRPRQRITHVSH